MKQKRLEEPMKTTFAHTCSLFLLRHYPCAWRERYADEAIAVLEERPATLRTLFDLAFGLLDAHLHAELFAERKLVMHQRLRNSQLAVFSSLVLFTIFWVLYILGTRVYQFDLPSWDLASNTPNFAFISATIRNVGLLAIVATLLGSGVLLSAAIKQAIARDRRNKAPFICILLSLLALALPITLFIAIMITPVSWMGDWYLLTRFIGLIVFFSLSSYIILTLLGNLLRLIQGIKSHELSWRFLMPTLLPALIIITLSGITAFTLAWTPLVSGPHALVFLRLAFVAALIIGTIFVGVSYLARKVLRITLSSRLLRLTFVPAVLTTLAMLIVFVLLLLQIISMDMSVNALGRTLLVFSALNMLVVCFAFPTIFACLALWRGFIAHRELALA
jgi:hypothetical protein